MDLHLPCQMLQTQGLSSYYSHFTTSWIFHAIWTVLNLADKGWMLLPPEKILQFCQGVLVHEKGVTNSTLLFPMKMQTAIAFLAQSWALGKLQPLLLRSGCAWLEDKHPLSFSVLPKIPVLCMEAELQMSQEGETESLPQPSSGSGDFNSFDPMYILPQSSPNKGETFMGHRGFRLSIPRMWTEYEQQLFHDLPRLQITSSCSGCSGT